MYTIHMTINSIILKRYGYSTYLYYNRCGSALLVHKYIIHNITGKRVYIIKHFYVLHLKNYLHFLHTQKTMITFLFNRLILFRPPAGAAAYKPRIFFLCGLPSAERTNS